MVRSAIMPRMNIGFLYFSRMTATTLLGSTRITKTTRTQYHLLKKLKCSWRWAGSNSITKQTNICQRRGKTTFTVERNDVTVTMDSFGECRKKKKNELKMIPYTHKRKEIKGRKSN